MTYSIDARPGKYGALTRYLLQLPAAQATVTLSFRDLGRIIGAELPASARKYRPWWANQTANANRPQAAGWMSAGFVVESVNLGAGTVRFARTRHVESVPSRSITSETEILHRSGLPLPTKAIPEVGEGTIGPRPSVGASGHRIVLVACAATKLAHRAAARDLYCSPLFKLSLAYARSLKPDAIFILSALHGLLELDTMVEPYNLTLKDLSTARVREWSGRVLGQLAREAELEKDEFIFLAGNAYRRHLTPAIAHWRAPLEGLPIGKQLQRLSGLMHGGPLR